MTLEPACTYPALMKVEPSIDDNILIEMLRLDPAEAVAELERFWREEEGESSGRLWNREEIYDRLC